MRAAGPELLASCYRRSIALAAGAGACALAFPGISTGVYGYPVEPAAGIAVATVRAVLADFPGIGEVVFCCFSDRDLAIYRRLLA